MMAHQLSFFEERSAMSCGDCLCHDCLLWWQGRCPNGGCYDDRRAMIKPYDVAHPNEPPRKQWSDWKTEQAFWCRGGIFYPQHICGSYVHYKGSEIKECIMANVQVFQDGYISCSCIDNIGCEECYRRLEERIEKAERTDTQ